MNVVMILTRGRFFFSILHPHLNQLCGALFPNFAYLSWYLVWSIFRVLSYIPTIHIHILSSVHTFGHTVVFKIDTC